ASLTTLTRLQPGCARKHAHTLRSTPAMTSSSSACRRNAGSNRSRLGSETEGEISMRIRHRRVLLGCVLLVGALGAHADLRSCAAIGDRDQRLACFDKLAAEAQPSIASTPVAAKSPQQWGALQQRRSDERDILDNPFVLTAYRPNYFLPFTYNSKINT